jgi:hypothetical protein
MIPRNLVISAVLMTVIAIGMGLYAWHIRGRITGGDTSVAEAHPLAPPVNGTTEQVTLYVAYDDPGVLRTQSARIPLPSGRQQRAEELLRALLQIYSATASPHPLASGAEIRDVYLVDPGTAVIDTNGAFADGHRSGILVEELTVASTVQTLMANIPGITQVKFLVEGQTRDTLAGHISLSGFFDSAAVATMTSALRAAQ